MTAPNYAKNYEVLMAVVTHLAVNKWAIRQPKGIAKDLSIDEADVKAVLTSFKGLFRESRRTSKDHGDYYYSLHLRHSRQITDDNSDVERPALDADYLFPLLNYISQKSAQESQQAVVMKGALLTASISLVASAVSLFIALHK